MHEGASEEQKFIAKPTQSNMNLFFWDGITASNLKLKKKALLFQEALLLNHDKCQN